MTALTEPLWFVLIALGVVWIGIRQLQNRPIPTPPCCAEALLSALAAETQRLRAAATQLTQAAQSQCAVPKKKRP